MLLSDAGAYGKREQRAAGPSDSGEPSDLFGDAQEVHLVCRNIHSAPNVYFFSQIVIGRHYFCSGLGGHDFPHS